MVTKIVERAADSVTVQVTFRLHGSMLENEETIQRELNGAGSLVTGEALSRFDADGSPIQVGDVRFTAKGVFPQAYQTPYGEVKVERHVYQSPYGGKTYCPLEHDARMVLNSTPRFAKVVSSKYAEGGAKQVARDLEKNHGRPVAYSYVKSLSDFVGAIAQAKEETWEYALPDMEAEVASVGIGLDGTCMLLRDDGWRQAMTGSISLYDKQGDRLHTIYTGAAPEYGKEKFRERFAREVERVRARYPDAVYVGLGDGASDNWEFLRPYVTRQVLDFYHVSEYVAEAAESIFPRAAAERTSWLEDRLHLLKHNQGAAGRLLAEMEGEFSRMKEGERSKQLRTTVTYFRNHSSRMIYARQVREGLPIGSGVTEAACKVLVKQRLCASGMRWKEQGASAVLSLRALSLTPGRWEQFWNRISQCGVPTL